MPDKARRLIVAIVVVMFLFIGFLLFRGGPHKTTSKTTTKKAAVDLTSYVDKDSHVELTTDGKINSDQQHRAIRIDVSPSDTTIDIINGYQGTVADSHHYDNNRDAYRNFLFALSRAGFTRERKTSLTDDRGVCPLGNRYFFDLYDEEKKVQQLWSTSCGGLGTLGGNSTLMITLFQRQIPDYNSVAGNVQL